jgi:hypothetical protein
MARNPQWNRNESTSTVTRNAELEGILEGINEASYRDRVAASAHEKVYSTPFSDRRNAMTGRHWRKTLRGGVSIPRSSWF